MLSVKDYKALLTRMPEAEARRILTLPASALAAMDPAVYLDAEHRLRRESCLTIGGVAADIPDTAWRMSVMAPRRQESAEKYGSAWCTSCGYDYGEKYMICPYTRKGEFLSMESDQRTDLDGNIYIRHTGLWIRNPCVACSPVFVEDYYMELSYRAEDHKYY